MSYILHPNSRRKVPWEFWLSCVIRRYNQRWQEYHEVQDAQGLEWTEMRITTCWERRYSSRALHFSFCNCWLTTAWLTIWHTPSVTGASVHWGYFRLHYTVPILTSVYLGLSLVWSTPFKVRGLELNWLYPTTTKPLHSPHHAVCLARVQSCL